MARPSAIGLVMRLAGAVAMLALGIGGSLWLTNPANLPIRQVALHGTLQYLHPVQLQEIIAEALTGNMLTQDLDGLEQRLEQSAWVRQARIRRHWPGTLRIEVVEQIPVARWEAGGLLNERGERFAMRGQQPEPSLLRIAGMPGREAVLLGYAEQIRTLLAPYGLRLVRLEETRFRSLHLTTLSGMRLTLGRVRPFERLARWLRYYEAYARTAPAPNTTIDLRYPNGFAVGSVTES